MLAAFPLAYATLLPALYLPLMVMLFGLIFRGVAFEFRPNARQSRRFWDLGFWLGSVVATLAQGMALGALITGFPETIVSSQEGSFAFLTVFNVICGIGLVAGYALLGACWLVLKPTAGCANAASRGTLGIVLAAYLAMISIWTPLAHPRVAERWFSFPNFLFLSVLLAAGFCWLNMMRSLVLRREHSVSVGDRDIHRFLCRTRDQRLAVYRSAYFDHSRRGGAGELAGISTDRGHWPVAASSSATRRIPTGCSEAK